MRILPFVAESFTEVRENAVRTGLQTLGVILGVASVVATLGMTAGMQARNDRYFRESGGTLLMGVYNQSPAQLELTARQRARMGLKLTDSDAIRSSVAGFDIVVAEISRRHRVRAGATVLDLTITAIEPEFREIRELEMASGRYLSEHDIATSAAVVVLGSTRARELFGSADPVGRRVTIGGEAYTVVGVTEEKVFIFDGGTHNGHEWMNRLVMVPITAYMKRHLSPGEDRIDELNLRLVSEDAHQDARAAVEQLLVSRHGVEDFGIWDRQERIAEHEQEGQVYNVAFLTCGVISLLVGGIVITNIMLASFTERMREVGVRKALGASGLQVLVQFLVEALVVTVLGGVVGLGLGIVFTTVLVALLRADMALTPLMVIAALGSAATVGLVFGLYPAIRASRLDPVEALRYE